ncbi:MAG: histidine--tRNA ligase, partial [Flavobacterium sp.]
GLDRIYLVMEELGLFPKTVLEGTRALFVNFGEAEARYAMRAVSALRDEGIAVDLYPDAAKMGKQMSYADKRGIPFVVLTGISEMESGTYTLKNMKSGEQQQVDIDQLVRSLK